MSLIDSHVNRLLLGLLASGLSVAALAQSVQFPTYQVGPQTNGTFIVSDGTILTLPGPWLTSAFGHAPRPLR
jgi:hypothetical protein